MTRTAAQTITADGITYQVTHWMDYLWTASKVSKTGRILKQSRPATRTATGWRFGAWVRI